MSKALNGITRAIGEVEALVDWVRYRKSGTGPYRIVPYRGHGTCEALYLTGRVLRGEPIPRASRTDSGWKNLLHTLRRLESDEVPFARVRARVGDATWNATADDDGYFRVRLDVPSPEGPHEVWRTVQLELVDPLPDDGAPVTATGHVLVAPSEARFGVISDIDDTVVKTDVTNLLRMLRLVFLTNAHTRLPFEGVAAFYRALHRGAAGDVTNPVYYVSSSPWNLYDLLIEVFEVHRIPVGPLFLRDYGLAPDKLLSLKHHDHKLEAIEQILSTHPGLPFVLLGDSGQKDPEIYREVVRRHPGRVRAVYIREVGEGTARDEEVNALAAEVAREGVPMLLTTDTVSAARHAAELGLIDPAALPEIEGEKARDRAAPTPFESAIGKE